MHSREPEVMPIIEDRSRTLGRKFRIIVSAIMTVVTEGRSETQKEVIRLMVVVGDL